MENQYERQEWNARWQRQIASWQDEIEHLLDQAEALVALIKLAKSQLQQDPPE